EFVAALAGGFGLGNPARRLAAARPGGAGFGGAVFRRHRRTHGGGCLLGGAAAGATLPAAEGVGDFFGRDIVFAHGAQNVIDDRGTLLLFECRRLFLQAFDFFFEFATLHGVIGSCHGVPDYWKIIVTYDRPIKYGWNAFIF